MVSKSEHIELPKKYTYEKYLGNGATSIVFQASCGGKQYAIKKVKQIFEHADYSRRTLREMRIMRKLRNHPNVSPNC